MLNGHMFLEVVLSGAGKRAVEAGEGSFPRVGHEVDPQLGLEWVALRAFGTGVSAISRRERVVSDSGGIKGASTGGGLTASIMG